MPALVLFLSTLLVVSTSTFTTIPFCSRTSWSSSGMSLRNTCLERKEPSIRATVERIETRKAVRDGDSKTGYRGEVTERQKEREREREREKQREKGREKERDREQRKKRKRDRKELRDHGSSSRSLKAASFTPPCIPYPMKFLCARAQLKNSTHFGCLPARETLTSPI